MYQNISNLLSIVTIGACFVQKIPQILILKKKKKTNGISLTSLLLDLFSYTVMTSYNYINQYSLLSYMEYPVILFEQMIFLYFVLKCDDRIDAFAVVAAFCYLLFTVCLITERIPAIVLTFLIPMCTPISASSKIVQLIAIIQTKNGTSISLLTWLLSAFTNITRIFTIWIDSSDILLLANYTVSAVLSSTIMFFAQYYKRQTKVD
ncbi:hypothetical protein HCN44_010369 [Aphidius gifuensis]|uniref:PQ-loop repeat-containing protein 3 n=1 Tax=Aphidius gifuensis TaxID=684658 RepID=A0A834XZ08_APHGI|nr:solute carrier family 66 member 3 [Aphidius gifuensis]KAF7993774.1 hypothetical protein HCN44_010369 [Aphidius gifuensis]